MKNKGFTLVELLAVIVILAIIMIIAIPAVLNTMQSANKSTFETYARRIANETQKKFTEDSLNNSNTQAKIYNITKDLGIDNTGDFKGYSIVSQKTNTVYLTLYNKEYAYVAVNMSNADLKRELKTISSVDPDYLTPEYLCSVVEEYTSCSYSVIDEDGNETNNLISPINHAFDAMLLPGTEIRNKIISLVPANEITKIKYSNILPNGVNAINLEKSSSKGKVYIWNDGTIIYYYTDAPYIFFDSNINNMFKDFENVEEIDTIKWRTDEVKYASNTFNNCKNLRVLDLSNLKMGNLINAANMFNNCNSLEVIDVSNWNVKKIENLNQTFINCNSVKLLDLSGWSFKSLDNLIGTFRYNENLELLKFPRSTNRVNNITCMVQYCYKLKRIENIEYFDATNLKTAVNSFHDCELLENLDLSKWVAPNLTTFSWVFQNCKSLKEIDFSGFNFSKVANLNGILYGCSSLENVIFGNKNFQSAAEFKLMFGGCKSLKEIDLSNANLANANSLFEMFLGCSSLKTANLSNVNASKLTVLQRMFGGCSGLTDINFTNFYAPNIENTNTMFQNCTNITNIDLSSINSSHVTDMNGMFVNCQNVEYIDISGIKSNSVIYMTSTFSNCQKLKKIYISSEWSNSSLIEKNSTFYNCKQLSGDINYSADKTSGDYAKVNGGYFTLKG